MCAMARPHLTFFLFITIPVRYVCGRYRNEKENQIEYYVTERIKTFILKMMKFFGEIHPGTNMFRTALPRSLFSATHKGLVLDIVGEIVLKSNDCL